MGKHVLFKTGIRRLGSKESSFFYRYPHRGETMREKLVLRRHREPKGAAGVGEGTYSPKPSGEGPGGRLRFRGQGAVPLPPQIQREQGTREVRANIAFLRRSAGDEACVTSNHLRHKYLDREKVLATMTRLMNAAYFRVGDERFAKKNKTCGIVTLRRKHLTIEGMRSYSGTPENGGNNNARSSLTPGCGGSWRSARSCQDKRSSNLDEAGEVRDVKARDLNAYVKEVMGGEYTPKDFRTWSGILIAAVKLAELGVTEDLSKAEENVFAAVDDVAKRLGNTRDIARTSYISPRMGRGQVS